MTDETKCPACDGTGDDPGHTWGNGDLPKPGMDAAAKKAARAKLQAMREGIDRQLASLDGGAA